MAEETKALSLFEKMAAITGKVGYIQKGGTNSHQGYSYARAEDVLKKVNEACSAAGICTSSESTLLQYGSRTKSNGKGENYAVVQLRLTFTDGKDVVTASAIGEGTDAGDKAVYKANTGAMKYALAGAFLISWGDDPEADPATDERSDEAPKKTVKKGGKKAAPKDDPADHPIMELIRNHEEDDRESVKEQIRALRNQNNDVFQAAVKLFRSLYETEDKS